MIRLCTAAALFAFPAAAVAGTESVLLANSVFVERAQKGEGDSAKTVLMPLKSMKSGDTLLFVVSFRNRGAEPASGLIVTNAVPQTVFFAGAEPGDALRSVDGGHDWGSLSSLTGRRATDRARPSSATSPTSAGTFPGRSRPARPVN